MLLRKPFDHKVDSWYIGFIMLSFFVEGDFILKLVKDKKKMYKDITTGNFKFIELYEKGVISLSCCDLMTRLLHTEPEKRISCKEALSHQWFKPIGSIFSDSFVIQSSKEIETMWLLY